MLFSFFSVHSSPHEGMLKGSLKRQLAWLWIVFYFSFFLFDYILELDSALLFWQYLIALCGTPDGGETILSEILDWLFRPTSAFL